MVARRPVAERTRARPRRAPPSRRSCRPREPAGSGPIRRPSGASSGVQVRPARPRLARRRGRPGRRRPGASTGRTRRSVRRRPKPHPSRPVPAPRGWTGMRVLRRRSALEALTTSSPQLRGTTTPRGVDLVKARVRDAYGRALKGLKQQVAADHATEVVVYPGPVLIHGVDVTPAPGSRSPLQRPRPDRASVTALGAWGFGQGRSTPDAARPGCAPAGKRLADGQVERPRTGRPGFAPSPGTG